jgi:hypothetical protein
MPRTLLSAVSTSLVVLFWLHGPAMAEPCNRETLRRVVDEAGARLRVLTGETQPRILAGIRKLKEKRGWTGPDSDDKVAAVMGDARTAELDSKAAELLARIDDLSEIAGEQDPQCSRLTELQATSSELQATVKAKAEHILALLEREVDGGSPKTVAKAPKPEPTPGSPVAPLKQVPAPAAAGTPPLPVSPPAPSTSPGVASGDRKVADAQRGERPVAATPLPPAVPAKPKPGSIEGWSTETSERAPLPPVPAPQPAPVMPALPKVPGNGFSRDEIREASQGFFGTISGGLGSVMEHAFSTLGRPSGYILGAEGGGAFIAGVRYGKGTLFLRDGSSRQVHWHGPSIGYDFGASGSKTIFLVYNIERDLDIFDGFSGVDGSAYLVGGVGMTVLTNGRIVMAPIRSGVGLRLGANIGYIRFTARPTWNPF